MKCRGARSHLYISKSQRNLNSAMRGIYHFYAVLAGGAIIAALDSLWFLVWIKLTSQKIFYRSVPNPLEGTITNPAWAVVLHALVASMALDLVASAPLCNDDFFDVLDKPAGLEVNGVLTSRTVVGAFLGLYTFFAFNITIASMYHWTVWDFLPDVAWGTGILSLVGFVQGKIIEQGC